MSGKIRIKLGEIEIEYEGDEQYLKNDLNSLLDKIGEFTDKHNIRAVKEPTKANTQGINTPGVIKGTTATIGAKLGASTGPDLIIAAAAKLTFVDGKATFGRKEILASMKEATGVYKKTYLDNLTGYLARVVQQQKLVQISADSYALEQELKKSLGAQLDN